MKIKFDEAKADLTEWNFSEDLEECFKPLIAKISGAIDKELRENMEVSVYDSVDGGPQLGITIPLDGSGLPSFGGTIPLDNLMEECLSGINDSPGDIKDWVAHLRRYLERFEAELKKAESALEAFNRAPPQQ